MSKYCKNMRMHFITNATVNSAMAMSMAKEVWCHESENAVGVSELVKVINQASLSLIKICESVSFAERHPEYQK